MLYTCMRNVSDQYKHRSMKPLVLLEKNVASTKKKCDRAAKTVKLKLLALVLVQDVIW